MMEILQGAYSIQVLQGRARIAELLDLPTQFIQSVDELATSHSLILEGKGIGDYEALEIAEALRAGSMPDLEWLRLSNNSIGDLGLEAIIVGITGLYEDRIQHFVSKVPPYLRKKLLISHDDPGLDFITRLGIAGIFFLLHLDLSFNLIQASGVLSLGEAIRKGLLAHLLNLCMDNNRIGVEGTQAFSKSVEFNHLKRLERLGMANNAIGDEGVVALSSALRAGGLPSLLELDLRSNGIGERGAMRLASVLEGGNPPRQRLDLTGNRVGKKAEEMFVDAFKSNFKLETQVELEWTRFQIQRKADAYRLRNRRFNRRFQDLNNEKKTEATSGRVIICGNVGVGKTTLRKSLEAVEANIVMASLWRSISFLGRVGRDTSAIFLRKQPSMDRGIEARYIENINEDKDYVDEEEHILSRLKIWDLSGRSELHLLHSRFLRDSVLVERMATTFVVVCRAGPVDSDSEDEEEENLELESDYAEELSYWLRFIAAGAINGMKRNVIIVLNRYRSKGTLYEESGWLDSELIAQLQVQFKDSLEIHEHPFIVDARSPDSVRKLKRHIVEHTNRRLRCPGPRSRGLREPTVCGVLREKVNKWAVKSSNELKSPVLNWKQLNAKFQKLGFLPRVLRAAAEYLDEVGDIILFSELGRKFDEECNSNQGLLVLSSEWFWGTVVTKLLLPEESLSISLKQRIERKGYIATEEALECLEKFSATDLHSKNLHVNDILAVLLRLGICYRLGPEKLMFPALMESGDETQLDWWDSEGTEWVLGRCYKLKDSEKTILPLALFYQLQVELASDRAFGDRADSEYNASKTLITFKCLGMAVMVECLVDEAESSIDRIDVLVKAFGEERNTAHGRNRRGQQVNLIECIFNRIQLISVHFCPRVEFSHYVLQPWSGATGTEPITDRIEDFSLDALKRLVLEEGSMASKSGRWSGAGYGRGFRDDELLSGDEIQEIQDLVDDHCSLGSQAMIDLGLISSSVEDLNEVEEQNERAGFGSDHDESSFSSITLDPQSSFSSLKFEHQSSFGKNRLSDDGIDTGTYHVIDERGPQWVKDVDNRRIIEFARIMPELRVNMAKSFERRDNLMSQICGLKRCSPEEQDFSVPRFMYLEKSHPSSCIGNVVIRAPEKPTTFTLQFLCENIQRSQNQTNCHVPYQKGLPVDFEAHFRIRTWLQKALPYLRWSLTVLHLLAEVGRLPVAVHAYVQLLRILPQYCLEAYHETQELAQVNLAGHICDRVKALLRDVEVSHQLPVEESNGKVRTSAGTSAGDIIGTASSLSIPDLHNFLVEEIEEPTQCVCSPCSPSEVDDNQTSKKESPRVLPGDRFKAVLLELIQMSDESTSGDFDMISTRTAIYNMFGLRRAITTDPTCHSGSTSVIIWICDKCSELKEFHTTDSLDNNPSSTCIG